MFSAGPTSPTGGRIAVGVLITVLAVGMGISAAAPVSAQTPLAPSIQITSPKPRAIVQRVDGALTPVTVRGTTSPETGPVEVRVVSRDELAPFASTWFRSPEESSVFAIEIALPPGWFDLQARPAASPDEPDDPDDLSDVITHGPFGVGEVYITAGQSNAANYGTVLTTPGDERVSALNIDTGTWTDGADPQPSAGGNAGSPWPSFASELAVAADVPVGIVAVGVGGDPIKYWDPEAPLGFTHYDRMKAAIAQLGPNGMRAILWHQGESDVRTDIVEYRDTLEALIARSRADAEFAVPWGVAIASNGLDSANVVKAQEEVIERDPLVFRGAYTNDFGSLGYLGDGIHFNREGLIEHAHRWFTTTVAFFDLVPATRQPGDLDCSMGAANASDVLAAARAAIGLAITGPAGLPLRCTVADGSDPERCDVDRDGVCTVRDALVVAKCQAGQPDACSIMER